MGGAEGKTVLVTGASSGIGMATALYLAERGYSVIGTSRSTRRLSSVVEEARTRGLPFIPAEMDINAENEIETLVPRLLEEHGPIDALVNNAGYGLWGPVQSLSMQEMREQFETNFFAGFRLIKAFLPGMIEKGTGTIVNVSSIAGRIGTPFQGAYVSSKFALEGLSESLRVELWPYGVRVVLVEPGLFRTNFFRNQVISQGVDSEEMPYGPLIARYRSRHQRFDVLKANPVKVAKVIHKVIRSRRPGFRYTVGPEAWLGAMGARLLPDRLFRALLSRATLGRGYSDQG